MSSKPTVVARNVSKVYRLNKDGYERGWSLPRNRKEVVALQEMSLVAYSGEAIGVIGRNGSGKSTLLSLISGNEAPTSGEILVSSQPTLLSVSAALQAHLTGRQNVRLGLLAKGLDPEEVDAMVDEVAEWADIGDAIDRPIRTYSSGMGSRLRFAISTAVRPDILLVDEALATGDAMFTKRAEARMNDFLDDASTVFLVSHSATSIRRHTSRAIWLHEGEMMMEGETPVVLKKYDAWSKAVLEGDRILAGKLIRRARNDFESPRIRLDGSQAR